MIWVDRSEWVEIRIRVTKDGWKIWLAGWMADGWMDAQMHMFGLIDRFGCMDMFGWVNGYGWATDSMA